MKTTTKRITMALVLLMVVTLLAVCLTVPSSAAEISYEIDGTTATAATEDDFITAIAGMGAGQTLKLLSDVSLTKTITVSKNLTIDLNGHTLTSTAGSAFSSTTTASTFKIYSSQPKAVVNAGKLFAPASNVSGEAKWVIGDDGYERSYLTINTSWLLFCPQVNNSNDAKTPTILNICNAKVVQTGGTPLIYGCKTVITADAKNTEFRLNQASSFMGYEFPYRNFSVTLSDCDVIGSPSSKITESGASYKTSTFTAKNTSFTNISFAGVTGLTITLDAGVTFNSDMSGTIDLYGNEDSAQLNPASGYKIALTTNGYAIVPEADAVTVTWKDGENTLRTDTYKKGETPYYNRWINSNVISSVLQGEQLSLYGFAPTAVNENIEFSVQTEPIGTAPVGFETTFNGQTTQYVIEQFADVLNAAEDGTVITLCADLALPSPISITKSITLDLGGHTLTAPQGFDYGITVKESGNVTIRNGAISAVNVVTALLNKDGSGTLTLQNLTIHTDESTKYVVLTHSGNTGNLTIDGCYFDVNIKVADAAALYLTGSEQVTITQTIFKDRYEGMGVPESHAMIYLNGANARTVSLANVKIFADQLIFRVTGSTDAAYPTITAEDTFLYAKGTSNGNVVRLFKGTRVNMEVKRSIVNVQRVFSLDANYSEFRFDDCYFVHSGDHVSEGAKTTSVYLSNTIMGGNFSDRIKNMNFYLDDKVIFTSGVGTTAKFYKQDAEGGATTTVATPTVDTSYKPLAGVRRGDDLMHYTKVEEAFAAMLLGDGLYLYSSTDVTCFMPADAQSADVELTMLDKDPILLSVPTEADLRTLIANVPEKTTIKLMRDYDILKTINITKDLYLDLNGKTICVAAENYKTTVKYDLFYVNTYGKNLYLYSSAPDAEITFGARFEGGQYPGFGFIAKPGNGAVVHLGYMPNDTPAAYDITYRGASVFSCAHSGGTINSIGGIFTREISDGVSASDNSNAFFHSASGGTYNVIGGKFHGDVFAQRNGTKPIVLLDGCEIMGNAYCAARMHNTPGDHAEVTMKNIKGGKLVASTAGGKNCYVILGEGCDFAEIGKNVFTSDIISYQPGVELATYVKDGATRYATTKDLPKLLANLTLTEGIAFNLYAPKNSGVVSINGETLIDYNNQYDAYRASAKMLPQNAHEDITYTMVVNVNGVEYTVTRTTSVLDYMARLLKDAGQSNESKQLIRALGNYMCEAVKYANAADATAIVTKITNVIGTDFNAATITGVERVDDTSDKIHSISIILDNAPQYALYLTEQFENVTLTYQTGSDSRTVRAAAPTQETKEGVTVYKYVFTVPAHAFESVTFAFGAHTYSYTLANYVNGQETAGTLANVQSICDALGAYTTAAKNYVNAQQ